VKRYALNLLSLATFLLFPFYVHSQCWPRSEKLMPQKSPNTTEAFGQSIDFKDDLAVIGAPSSDTARTSSGVVYVMKFDGSAWNKIASLVPSDHRLYHGFGRVVKILGNYILVGDPNRQIEGVAKGAIYVFEKPVGGWRDMVETTIITSSDPRCLSLGADVDVHENTILAGAPYSLNDDGKNVGAAYVFELQGNAFWRLHDSQPRTL